MQGNDLSNSYGPRTLVHVSDVFIGEIELSSVLIVIPTLRTGFTPNMLRISEHSNLAARGMRFDLFCYEDDGYPGNDMYDGLDGISHPFNNFLIFRHTPNLSDYLLVNNDVKHVIDPLHRMAFGSKSA